ncbi:MAG: hypothetical protein Q7U92_06435 [Bradyrhizobium sp.]|nr:hypothetical protein [Bradyrhizobium sp.]
MGQIIRSPKPSSNTVAAVRRLLGSKSKILVMALSASAVAENDRTKPAAIIAGRTLPVWPTEAPSRIGSIGSVQGAAMVTIPASSARMRLSIEQDLSNDPRSGRVATREISIVLRAAGLRRYLDRAPAASRVCEKIGWADPGAVSAPQKQSDPEGGIPSGSLEVTWKVKDLEG